MATQNHTMNTNKKRQREKVTIKKEFTPSNQMGSNVCELQ